MIAPKVSAAKAEGEEFGLKLLQSVSEMKGESLLASLGSKSMK